MDELESIQEEGKEVTEDDNYSIPKSTSQYSTPNFDHIKSQTNYASPLHSISHHRKTSSLISNDKQIIIVNNINVTNTNFNTTNPSAIPNLASFNSSEGSFGTPSHLSESLSNNQPERQQRKITIRKRPDEESVSKTA